MKAFENLVKSLDQLVTVYRHLLDMVQKENEVLVAAEMKEVPVINEAKEKLVHKVRQLDHQWQLSADELAKTLGINKEQPTLLELAKSMSGEQKEKLENLHKVLNLLVNQIAETNKKNKELVDSILSHITGAMDSITKTLNENPTYKNSGNMEKKNQDAQGRLVYKEA